MAFGNIFGQSDIGFGGTAVGATAGASVDTAWGPPSSGSGGAHPLHPTAHSFGGAFWTGVLGFAILIMVRRSLPA